MKISIRTLINTILGFVVGFILVGALLPTAQQEGDDLNATGVPLGSLFVGSGVVFVIFMANFLLDVLGLKKK